MLTPKVHITLTSKSEGKTFRLDFCAAVKVESSWKNLTDTCEITLPKRIFYKDKKLKNIIHAGDPVSVTLGYDDRLFEEFNGFVTRLSANVPLTIYCEDGMYQLKKGSISFSRKAATLQDVADELRNYYAANGFNFSVRTHSAALGSFRVHEATGSAVLQKLKEVYGIFSYFRNNTLYIGFPLQIREMERPRRFLYLFSPDTQRKLEPNIISHNLEFRTKDDIKLKVKAINHKPDNTREVVTLGEDGGDTTTLNFYNVPAGKLKEHAEAELARLQYNGWRGSIVSFGLPSCQHGDVAVLNNDEDGDGLEGSYFIDSITKEFSVGGGYRRTIELGQTATSA